MAHSDKTVTPDWEKFVVAEIDVKELVIWIARNSEADPLTTCLASPFGINFVINSDDLLDHIHELTSIPKEVLGDWVAIVNG